MKSVPLAVGLVSAAFLFVQCGKSSSGQPTPLPSVPAPTPTPSTPGGGVGASCSLGNGSVYALCSSGKSRLPDLVETAINQLVHEKPQIFDLKDVSVPNSDYYKVLDTEAYLDGVVTNLRRQGACAERDSDDALAQRIVVKTSNDFSEGYDVLTPNGYVRRTNTGYVSTCNPASFPIERNSEDIPPAGSGCGRPYPPEITRFNCKVHIKAPEYYTLDSTPLVGPDVAYCASIGFTDGRSMCPVRTEGSPDRVACENWRVGKAEDTGRLGPTWTNEETGKFCTGPESNCTNSPDSQYALYVYRSGQFRVAAENGAYCIVTVDR
jgi:hypothetical protein